MDMDFDLSTLHRCLVLYMLHTAGRYHRRETDMFIDPVPGVLNPSVLRCEDRFKDMCYNLRGQRSDRE